MKDSTGLRPDAQHDAPSPAQPTTQPTAQHDAQPTAQPTRAQQAYANRVFPNAQGALTGVAIGDALGMPTQSMSAAQIAHYYGGPVTGLMDAVPEQPIAPNMKAGAVTDDTEQAFLLAHRLLADEGAIDTLGYANDLLAWEQRMKDRGSLDLLGPSTKAALHALQDGIPAERTGLNGTTNGGAMRAAPVGIAFAPYAPGRALARAARRSCIVTHNTEQGIEATTLVAAAVSFGVEGEDCPLERAAEFVEEIPERGHWTAKASVLARTHWLLDWATEGRGRTLSDDAFADFLRDSTGTSVEANESVPVAFAIAARFFDRPMAALKFAASIGGDTDTIGAMCGAMLGAAHTASAFDPAIRTQVVDQLRADNGLDVDTTARGLCALRARTRGED
ncbi:MAG: ADP-ribosylglycohydrolase family protein [Bifidobacterium sp.]|nr:ADP-ribosylglycohydrolase family protein [Bifidobacterium sp.]